MTLQRIEYFITLAQTLSFSRTAALHYVSQATITQQIQILENELGTPLFIRTRRHVALTEAGRVFFEDAVQIRNLIQKSEERARRAGTLNREQLHILVINGIGCGFFCEKFLLFREQFPNIDAHCHYCSAKDILIKTYEMEADIAFQFDVPTDLSSSLEKEVLFSSGQYVLVSNRHHLAGHTSLIREQLTNETFITLKEALSITPILGPRSQTNAQGTGRMEIVETMDEMLLQVSMGNGYAILSELMTHVISPEMHLVLIPLREAPIPLSAYWNGKNNNPAIGYFFKFWKESKK